MKSRHPRKRKIDNQESAILLGAHMSIAGGVHRAIERARSIECSAMQIFVKNNMQWFARPFTRAEIKAFLDHPQRGELGAVFAHANYLINLAATNPQFHANSIRALSEELTRTDQLGLPFLVLHPGAHLGAGEETGLKKVASSIDRVFDRARNNRGPRLVPWPYVRASRLRHRARPRAGAALRLPRHCARFCGWLRPGEWSGDAKNVS